MDSLFQAGAWRVAAAAGYSFPAAMSTESRLELRSRRTRLESPRSGEDALPALDLLVDLPAGGTAPPALAARGAELLAPLDDAPAVLRRTVVRIPQCFRSFDLGAEDMRRLATAFAARRADRSRPLLVVGLRTAGSYLAPLAA